MRTFEFTVPTRVLLGKEAEDQVAEYISLYGSRVLVHFGGSHIRNSGLLDKIERILATSGIYYEELGGVKPNPRLSLVKEGIMKCREHKLDLILAIGGASVIDSAKAIGIGVPYDGDVWDFYEGKAEIKESLPVGVVLTVAGAGSEAAEGAVITNEEGWMKRSVGSYFMRPKFALLNPLLTCSLSAYQTACGVSDTLSHIMEYYFTAETHTEVSDRMCEGVMNALIHNGRLAVRSPDNYDVRAEVMWAAVIAQMGFLNCGRNGQWAAHEIEHEISAIYDVPHGAGMSVVFPAWMEHVKEELPERFLEFAKRVWNIDEEESYGGQEAVIEQGIEAYRNYLRELGLPLTFGDLGISGNRIEEMAAKAAGTKTLGSSPKLNQDDVIQILYACQ
ncbi:MAG: iron-containing alcohol dehydrogenase [Clostridium sp.]|nr:iron-containing alcohol dehydrogenase [Clostridium sp.]